MMFKISSRYLLTAAACTAALLCGAQSLEKEITIDREIVPAQRAARKPLVFPLLEAPAVPAINLRMDAAPSAVPLTPGIQPFNPAATPDAFAPTPWRGYLDLGYFPTAEVGLSAGYTAVQTPATRLNVWLQGGNSYYKSKGKSEVSTWHDRAWKALDIAVGADLAQKIGERNRLTVGLDVAYSGWSSPRRWVLGSLTNSVSLQRAVQENGLSDITPSTDIYYYNPLYPTGLIISDDPYEENFTDNNLRFHFRAGFDGRNTHGLSYGIGASVGTLHNKKITGLLPADSQTDIAFNGNLRKAIDGNAGVSLKVEGDFLRSSSYLTPGMLVSAAQDALIIPQAKTIGQVDFIPAVDYNNGMMYGRAGARLGVSVNSGKTFHVAPDVLLGINPDSRFGAWLRLDGGVKANSLESLYMRSRYSDTRMAYGLSNLAFAGQLGVRVGPFSGASLTLTADYAAANNWLMPLQLVCDGGLCNIFAPSDLRAWKFGAAIDWQYRSLVAVCLRYETTPGSSDRKSWIDWDDRARHVVDASLAITPIAPLSVEVGFTGRFSRRQSVLNPTPRVRYVNGLDYYVDPAGYALGYSLGDWLDLRAGASWRFNEALTVFARVNNLLGRHDAGVFNVPGHGLTGLVGVAYKF